MVEGLKFSDFRKVWNWSRIESKVVLVRFLSCWPGSMGRSLAAAKKAVKRRREDKRRLAVLGGAAAKNSW